MSVQKVGSKALAVVKESDQDKKPQKPKKKVLKEEEYVAEMEKIIVRDFFPDLPKLEAQREYHQALETNDLNKLRELHIKYSIRRGPTPCTSTATPSSTFATPSAGPQATPGQSNTGANDDSNKHTETEEERTDNPDDRLPEKPEKKLSLDHYLAKTTSEDNASFTEIMKLNEEKHRQQHAWLYENEETRKEDAEKALALPSVEEQAAIKGGNTELQSWQYQARNSLMYVPDGVDQSAKQKIDNKGKAQEISHANTRFEKTPFNEQRRKEAMVQAASAQALSQLGKIGHDGKEIVPEESPKVAGYGFVRTPSPAPGVDASPLMTWGEVEGTPFRLDGSDTPISDTPGPVFKIPSIPKRDRIAHELAEKASMAYRNRKEKALKSISSRHTPSPSFMNSPKTDRLANLSPAAQRLAGTKLGIRTHTDKALKASYTPSPRNTPGEKTPVMLSQRKTPRTPKESSLTPKHNTPTPKRDSSSTLTDNLLKLPRKRMRAQDFF